jgi:hypothetical protein
VLRRHSSTTSATSSRAASDSAASAMSVQARRSRPRRAVVVRNAIGKVIAMKIEMSRCQLAVNERAQAANEGRNPAGKTPASQSAALPTICASAPIHST